jgi:hypothetical protein
MMTALDAHPGRRAALEMPVLADDSYSAGDPARGIAAIFPNYA